MKKSDYPSPHAVTMIYREIPAGRGRDPFSQVQTLLVDDQPLCLPKDAVVNVEVDTGGVGYRITTTIVARTINSEAYEYEAKHLQDTR